MECGGNIPNCVTTPILVLCIGGIARFIGSEDGSRALIHCHPSHLIKVHFYPRDASRPAKVPHYEPYVAWILRVVSFERPGREDKSSSLPPLGLI